MEMQFNQANVQQVQGLGQARVSQMKTSPLAFEILSKKLYRNKISAPINAVMREASGYH